MFGFIRHDIPITILPASFTAITIARKSYTLGAIQTHAHTKASAQTHALQNAMLDDWQYYSPNSEIPPGIPAYPGRACVFARGRSLTRGKSQYRARSARQPVRKRERKPVISHIYFPGPAITPAARRYLAFFFVSRAILYARARCIRRQKLLNSNNRGLLIWRLCLFCYIFFLLCELLPRNSPAETHFMPAFHARGLLRVWGRLMVYYEEEGYIKILRSPEM